MGKKDGDREMALVSKSPRVENILVFLPTFEKPTLGLCAFSWQKSIDFLGIYLAPSLVQFG